LCTYYYLSPPTEYHLCQSGSQQSPIDLNSIQNGLANSHTPSFSPKSYHAAEGLFFNWGFGPGFTYHMAEGAFTSLPKFSFDDRTVYLAGWHMHFPSEHLVDGVRSKAEMHFVHVDEKGEPAAVIGLRIDLSSSKESAFLKQLPAQLLGVNDTSGIEGVRVDPFVALAEADMLRDYFTYTGSLTTPPCSEGLRWFIPRQPIYASLEQLLRLKEASRYSHRIMQQVWLHGINQ